jgi:hypothetical protein
MTQRNNKYLRKDEASDDIPISCRARTNLSCPAVAHSPREAGHIEHNLEPAEEMTARRFDELVEGRIGLDP